MNAYNRFSHIAYNIALSCFIIGCIPKYLNFEGSNLAFTVGGCGLAIAFLLKAFELPKNQ